MIEEKEFLSEIEALLTGFWLTDLANFSACVFHRMDRLNWAGFYLSDGKMLRLGPFVGKPACTEISFQRGVCGAAFLQKEILLVKDVHEFPGHIACDPISRSELVIPFEVNGKLIGVLDLDSPQIGRFQEQEAEILKKGLRLLALKNPNLESFPNLPAFSNSVSV